MGGSTTQPGTGPEPWDAQKGGYEMEYIMEYEPEYAKKEHLKIAGRPC